MNWTDVPETDRAEIVSMLRSRARSMESEVERWRRMRKAQDLKDWNARRLSVARNLRIAAQHLERK
jgi:hypothetical protein